MDNEKFFENLANGKVEAESGVAETPRDDEPKAELAKAKTSAVARRVADDYEPEGQLTVDVYQTPDDIVIESAIAGVKPEDIDINVTSDSISIRGARRHEQEARGNDYLYQECYWGRFSRSIILPQEIDPESADVTFRNGILTIRLPKANRKKTRKLKVRID